jgi:hypothetical protein
MIRSRVPERGFYSSLFAPTKNPNPMLCRGFVNLIHPPNRTPVYHFLEMSFTHGVGICGVSVGGGAVGVSVVGVSVIPPEGVSVSVGVPSAGGGLPPLH